MDRGRQASSEDRHAKSSPRKVIATRSHRLAARTIAHVGLQKMSGEYANTIRLTALSTETLFCQVAGRNCSRRPAPFAARLSSGAIWPTHRLVEGDRRTREQSRNPLSGPEGRSRAQK